MAKLAPRMSLLARSYPRGTQLGFHVHREAQLLYAASGVMQVTTPEGRWLVPPQRAVWVPPRLEHAVDALADIEMRTFLIEPRCLKAHPLAARLTHEFVIQVRPLLRELILSAFAEELTAERAGLIAQLALYELVKADNAETFMPMPSEPRAHLVAEMILADPRGARDLAEMAREAGSSARTITRLFPEETKLTLKEWRQRARILAAIEMLGGTRLSIKQVSAKLGFSSVAAFGHAFRQVMGTTPSDFVRKHDN